MLKFSVIIRPDVFDLNSLQTLIGKFLNTDPVLQSQEFNISLHTPSEISADPQRFKNDIIVLYYNPDCRLKLSAIESLAQFYRGFDKILFYVVLTDEIKSLSSFVSPKFLTISKRSSTFGGSKLAEINAQESNKAYLYAFNNNLQNPNKYIFVDKPYAPVYVSDSSMRNLKSEINDIGVDLLFRFDFKDKVFEIGDFDEKDYNNVVFMIIFIMQIGRIDDVKRAAIKKAANIFGQKLMLYISHPTTMDNSVDTGEFKDSSGVSVPTKEIIYKDKTNLNDYISKKRKNFIADIKNHLEKVAFIPPKIIQENFQEKIQDKIRTDQDQEFENYPNIDITHQYPNDQKEKKFFYK